MRMFKSKTGKPLDKWLTEEQFVLDNMLICHVVAWPVMISGNCKFSVQCSHKVLETVLEIAARSIEVNLHDENAN